MAQSPFASCCAIWQIILWIIPPLPQKSIKLRRRSSGARRTSTRIWTRWYAYKRGACAPNSLSTMALRERRIQIGKEYQIATEVFGRQKDFDPHLDSMVRVQAGRLRAKLAEYYGSEGAEDSILVEMPKGNYVLTFHQRPPGTGHDHAASSHDTSDALPGNGQPSRKWLVAIIALSVFLAAGVAIATDRFLTRRTAEARLTSDSADLPVAFHLFWRGFLTGPQEPWVIFSNAAFVGRPYTGMRYFNRARDSSAVITDHY